MSKVFNMLTDRLGKEVELVIDEITQTLKLLHKDDINEDFAKKFKAYSNKIANLVVAPQQIKSLNVYLNALSLLCADQIGLCHSVTSNSIELV